MAPGVDLIQFANVDAQGVSQAVVVVIISFML
jgi:hypothetical protein